MEMLQLHHASTGSFCQPPLPRRRTMAPPPEELVEEILLRFAPSDPARLVRAALVCKPWRAIISDPRFRRRFREFHRTPPLLGFVCNANIEGGRRGKAEFVATCSFPASPVRSRRSRVLDAHHGRVLLHGNGTSDGFPCPQVIMVWDPATDEQEEVPIPAVAGSTPKWTAGVVCAAGDGDHLDCHRAPFLVVFLGYVSYDPMESETVLCTYSSSAASWGEPISALPMPYNHYKFTHPAHVGSALYFGSRMTNHILKYDMKLHKLSWIQSPSKDFCREMPYVLSTTKNGGLGLAAVYGSSKLYIWSRDDASESDAIWTPSRVIELKILLPVCTFFASADVLGFSVGMGVVFVRLNGVLYAIDLKTHKVIKKVSKASGISTIVPYMSFYTPAALGAVSTDEGP